MSKKIDGALRRITSRHYGPGSHSGTGTSQDVHGAGGGPRADAPQGLKRIVKIVSVKDTREYDDSSGKWKPITGTGEEHYCDRCGKLHEVHATVQLEDGSMCNVGTTCARAEFSEQLRKQMQSKVRAAKRLRVLELEMAEKQKAQREWDEALVEVKQLPFPDITLEEEESFQGRPLKKARMGDAVSYFSIQDTFNDERRRTLENSWQMKRMNERGFGSVRPHYDRVKYERQLAKTRMTLDRDGEDVVERGGQGSGFYGHRGRQGAAGGKLPRAAGTYLGGLGVPDFAEKGKRDFVSQRNMTIDGEMIVALVAMRRMEIYKTKPYRMEVRWYVRNKRKPATERQIAAGQALLDDLVASTKAMLEIQGWKRHPKGIDYWVSPWSQDVELVMKKKEEANDPPEKIADNGGWTPPEEGIEWFYANEPSMHFFDPRRNKDIVESQRKQISERRRAEKIAYIESQRPKTIAKSIAGVFRRLVARHYGPGPHPGTGTEQTVHGSGGGARASTGGAAKRPEHVGASVKITRLLNPVSTIHVNDANIDNWESVNDEEDKWGTDKDTGDMVEDGARSLATSVAESALDALQDGVYEATGGGDIDETAVRGFILGLIDSDIENDRYEVSGDIDTILQEVESETLGKNPSWEDMRGYLGVSEEAMSRMGSEEINTAVQKKMGQDVLDKILSGDEDGLSPWEKEFIVGARDENELRDTIDNYIDMGISVESAFETVALDNISDYHAGNPMEYDDASVMEMLGEDEFYEEFGGRSEEVWAEGTANEFPPSKQTYYYGTDNETGEVISVMQTSLDSYGLSAERLNAVAERFGINTDEISEDFVNINLLASKYPRQGYGTEMIMAAMKQAYDNDAGLTGSAVMAASMFYAKLGGQYISEMGVDEGGTAFWTNIQVKSAYEWLESEKKRIESGDLSVEQIKQSENLAEFNELEEGTVSGEAYDRRGQQPESSETRGRRARQSQPDVGAEGGGNLYSGPSQTGDARAAGVAAAETVGRESELSPIGRRIRAASPVQFADETQPTDASIQNVVAQNSEYRAFEQTEEGGRPMIALRVIGPGGTDGYEIIGANGTLYAGIHTEQELSSLFIENDWTQTAYGTVDDSRILPDMLEGIASTPVGGRRFYDAVARESNQDVSEREGAMTEAQAEQEYEARRRAAGVFATTPTVVNTTRLPTLVQDSSPSYLPFTNESGRQAIVVEVEPQIGENERWQIIGYTDPQDGDNPNEVHAVAGPRFIDYSHAVIQMRRQGFIPTGVAEGSHQTIGLVDSTHFIDWFADVMQVPDDTARAAVREWLAGETRATGGEEPEEQEVQPVTAAYYPDPYNQSLLQGLVDLIEAEPAVIFRPRRDSMQAERMMKRIEVLKDEQALRVRHYGPGPHPGTGTSQDVHGSGGGARGDIELPESLKPRPRILGRAITLDKIARLKADPISIEINPQDNETILQMEKTRLWANPTAGTFVRSAAKTLLRSETPDYGGLTYEEARQAMVEWYDRRAEVADKVVDGGVDLASDRRLWDEEEKRKLLGATPEEWESMSRKTKDEWMYYIASRDTLKEMYPEDRQAIEDIWSRDLDDRIAYDGFELSDSRIRSLANDLATDAYERVSPRPIDPSDYGPTFEHNPVMVAKIGNEVVGAAQLEVEPGKDYVYIDSIGMKYPGRGHGTQLMLGILEYADGEGKGIRGDAISSARSFYERLGAVMASMGGKAKMTREEVSASRQWLSEAFSYVDSLDLDSVEVDYAVQGEMSFPAEVAPKPSPEQMAPIVVESIVRHYGPGDHPSGSPQTVHGTKGPLRRPSKTRVGITSAIPGKPSALVFEEMGDFIEKLNAIESVTNAIAIPGLAGSSEWGREPTWVVSYSGNGLARDLIARTALEKEQDAIILITEGNTEPVSEFTFADPVTPPERDTIESLMDSVGLSGWTWFKIPGQGGTVQAANISQWGGDPDAHKAATKQLRQMFDAIEMPHTLVEYMANVEIMEKEGNNAYQKNFVATN